MKREETIWLIQQDLVKNEALESFSLAEFNRQYNGLNEFSSIQFDSNFSIVNIIYL